MSIEDIFQKALSLPDSERLLLAERIFGSLEHLSDDEVTADWEAEVGRRLTTIDEGHVELIEHDDALLQMFGEDAID